MQQFRHIKVQRYADDVLHLKFEDWFSQNINTQDCNPADDMSTVAPKYSYL